RSLLVRAPWDRAAPRSGARCISHVVSNDVRSDILLTTIHVITDQPISDHMIGTSHRGPVQRSVIVVPRAPRKRAQAKMMGAVYERQSTLALQPF
ncbi:unnamed protein product, partial [Staurois parvus]